MRITLLVCAALVSCRSHFHAFARDQTGTIECDQHNRAKESISCGACDGKEPGDRIYAGEARRCGRWFLSLARCFRLASMQPLGRSAKIRELVEQPIQVTVSQTDEGRPCSSISSSVTGNRDCLRTRSARRLI